MYTSPSPACEKAICYFLITFFLLSSLCQKTLSRIKTFWQYLVLCLVINDCMAQSASQQMGARAHGMAFASGCLTDIWSLHNNVAGLAKTDRASAAFAYHAVPSFRFFDRMAAVFAAPIKSGAVAAGVFRFGDDLYSEQILSLGFANTFGLAALGLRADYMQYRAEGMATTAAFTVSFGGIATITNDLTFGAHIAHINQPIINELTEERIPTILTAAVACKLSQKLLLTNEIEKDVAHTPVWKSGLEYKIVKKVALRTGFNLNPQSGFFGIGFNSRRLDFDYALQLNDALGASHQASVIYQFKKP
jgi:hypothetical protein